MVAKSPQKAGKSIRLMERRIGARQNIDRFACSRQSLLADRQRVLQCSVFLASWAALAGVGNYKEEIAKTASEDDVDNGIDI